jgi:hypothetical protein
LETTIRRQLTLFVDEKDAREIEWVRQRFNPRQHELIASHVTLCREDEIENLPAVLRNLQQLHLPAITIPFGAPVRFDDGRGVLLPALGDNASYHALRSLLLHNICAAIRKPAPHITLMHPRNAVCTDEIIAQIQQFNFPTQLSFNSISLIEQINGGRWRRLQNFPLNDE